MKSKILFPLLIVSLVVVTACIFAAVFVKPSEPQNVTEDEIPVSTVTFSHFEMYVPEDNTEDLVEHEPENEPKLLGEFVLTAYCPCGKCCGKWAENRVVDGDGKAVVVGSTGKRLFEGKSIAVDPKVIPYGTTVLIGGKAYTADDCGGAIKGNRIDVFFESHDAALDFGRQTMLVYQEVNQ